MIPLPNAIIMRSALLMWHTVDHGIATVSPSVSREEVQHMKTGSVPGLID